MEVLENYLEKSVPMDSSPRCVKTCVLFLNWKKRRKRIKLLVPYIYVFDCNRNDGMFYQNTLDWGECSQLLVAIDPNCGSDGFDCKAGQPADTICI